MLLKDFYGPFEGVNLGLAGMGDCESLRTRQKTEKVIAEKYLARHFLSFQQASGGGDSEHANCSPGTENPADGLAKARGTWFHF